MSVLSIPWGKRAEDAIRRIDLLVRSGHPLLYVVSHEEKRVENALKRICKARKRELYIWTVASGVLDSDGYQLHRASDAIEVLGQVRKRREPAIWLLKDFHRYLDDALTVRFLRDIVGSKEFKRTIVLLAPSLSLPHELEKESAVVEFPLPTHEEVDALLDAFIKRYRREPAIRVNLSEDAKRRIVRSAVGLTLGEIENIFYQALLTEHSLDDADVEVVLKAKKEIVRRSGILEYREPSETLDDAGGLYGLKEWLKRRRNAFSDEARSFGLPFPKGVMLVGIQGCGKSLCAKAIASLWRLPLLQLDVSKIFSKFIGSSEQNMADALRLAEALAPCVLWVDEVEKAFSGVKSSGMSDAGTTARVFGYFLTWLQEKESAVFVAATANDISQLPPEFLRRGRFDEMFFVDLPTEPEREEILKIHLNKRGRSPDSFDIESIVAASEGYTGAEIEQAIISALYEAFDDGMRKLRTEDIIRALKETVPLSVIMAETVESMRSWAKGRCRPATKTDYNPLMEDGV